MEFVDIHSHILPEVDDGASTFDRALLMIEEVRVTGIRKMLLTPLDSLDGKLNVLDRIADRFLKLQARDTDKVAGIKLHRSAELMMLPDLPDIAKKRKEADVEWIGEIRPP